MNDVRSRRNGSHGGQPWPSVTGEKAAAGIDGATRSSIPRRASSRAVATTRRACRVGRRVGLGRGALYYYMSRKRICSRSIHNRVIVEVLAAGERAIALDKLRLGAAAPARARVGERDRFISRSRLGVLAPVPQPGGRRWPTSSARAEGHSSDRSSGSSSKASRRGSSRSRTRGWRPSVGSAFTTTSTSGTTRTGRSRRL